MKLIFEDLIDDMDREYTYSIEIESIIFNNDNLDESLVEETASGLANKIIDQIESNNKYIKDALGIENFEVSESGFISPVLQLEFKCDRLVDNNTLTSTIGRYTTVQHEENFNVNGKTSSIKFKPVRNELKIGLLA